MNRKAVEIAGLVILIHFATAQPAAAQSMDIFALVQPIFQAFITWVPATLARVILYVGLIIAATLLAMQKWIYGVAAAAGAICGAVLLSRGGSLVGLG